jgi:hypothetical protein
VLRARVDFAYPKGQARDGVLELELQDVDKLNKSMFGPAMLRGECKHGKSVTSAYWDPRGRSIVSTSYDDTLRSTLPSRSASLGHIILHYSPYSMGYPSVTHEEGSGFSQPHAIQQNQP